MANRVINNWWVGGLTAMIPSVSCAVLLATHRQGVSDGCGRIMVGFIVVGVVGGLRRIPVAALAEFVARRKGAAWREGSKVAESEGGEPIGSGSGAGEPWMRDGAGGRITRFEDRRCGRRDLPCRR